MTNTYSTKAYSDMSFPRGLPIPFTNKTIPLKNRLRIDSNAQLVSQKSYFDVEKQNKDIWSVNATADYEVSQNFRAALGGGWSRTVFTAPLEDIEEKENNNFTTLEINGRLTIQF